MRRKMKSQLNKILIVTLVILFFSLSKSYSMEDVTEFTDAINEAREEFNNSPEASTEQSKIIDEALKEIDKATEYAQEAINANNAEDAIKTLEFIEKTLGDVQSIIPQEFGSDMSKMDISAMAKEDMEIITELTTQMKTAKEKKQKDFMSDLVEINLKGIDTASISEKLNSLGVNTIKLDLVLNKDKKIESWTKEDWANSYTGSILTSDGQEVVADKEISSRMIELEEKFKKNTLNIENKRIELVSLSTQLDPLNSELQSLDEKKSLLSSQYNAEISKLSTEDLSNLETQKSIELSEKLKNELENVTSEALKAEQQSALLKTEITSLNKSLNEQILQSNKISEDINNLNSNKLELTETIALKAAQLNGLKGQSSNLSSNSNITELTAKLEDSEKLKSELSNLQSQIENKNLTVNQKISQINSLNTELNPLADQINLLKENKENLQKQYNSELTNISNSFNLDDLSKSKELAANLNNEINSVSSEIKSIEANSLQIKTDISQLDFQISSEKGTLNKISIELANAQKELNSTNATVSSKELELDRLLNTDTTDLAQTNQKLNQQLKDVSLQKDFIESQFDKSIDLEVEAAKRYYSALGDINSENYGQEVEFAMEEVGIILDGDPRKANAFDIRKFGTYAGLSQSDIQVGINAINNDDWDTSKKVYKNILTKLSKNPNWVIDVPSEAELNVLIAEEKALQQAVDIIKKGDEVKRQIDSIINEKTKPYQELSQLNKTNLQYAVLFEGSGEKKFFDEEYNKIIKETDIVSLQQEINIKQKEATEIQKAIQETGQRMLAEASSIKTEAQNFQIESFNLTNEKNEWLSSINEADKTVSGGFASLYRDRGNSNWSEWNRTLKEFEGKIYQANNDYSIKQTEFIQKAYNNNPMYKYDPSLGKLQGEISSLSMKMISENSQATQKARSNVIALVDDAKLNIEKITKDEISKNADYNYADQVNKILDEIPTFDDSAKQKRVNEVLTGINVSWGYQVAVGDQAAALRAALGDENDYEAYQAALKAMGEMGVKPVLGTGPYWEMTNVKAAAIVRSKKYDYVDDYAYMNAYYEEPLQLNTTERQELEGELKNVLGKNNPKFDALTKQTNSLKSEIETNNVQLSNINSNISKLENEIGSIKSLEQNLENQVSKLTNDLTSKQSLINGKNKSLTDLQKSLDPINNKISELEVKKNVLNNNVQNQINVISQNTKKSEEISQKTLELENKLSKEISEIDQQINGYKKETEKLTVNISSLNNEVLNLENEKPDLSDKISKINEELTGYSNVKAELSVLTTEQKAEVENIDIEINKLEGELSNLKTSESQINQQLASLSNELKSKEDIIKNNNLSISEIQNQIDPLNSQIETFENQKVSLNEQFNKDFAELSNQIEQTTETRSEEIDKLKVDFETQISSLNEEINNFESQTSKLNRSVSALDEEIKSIEVETPQLTNQIAKLNQEIENFTDIKANLAMATAKNIGIKVDEKAIKSLGKLEGKAIISIKGTELVRVVDEKMLINQAEKFIDPISSFSLNTKIYSAEAINPEVLVLEEITNTYSKAKAARVVARENLAAIEASPEATKEEIQAAEAAVYTTKLSEIAAGQSLVSNNTMSKALTTPQQTLENLRAIRNTPGADKWSVRRTEAAIKQLEAQIAGKSYNYEQAVNKISNDEQKFNVWREKKKKKEIEAAKASGNQADLKAYTRRLKNFQNRLVDQQKAVVEIQTQQTNYSEVLNNVAAKTSALSGVPLNETVKVAVQETLTSSNSISVDAQETVVAEASALQAAGASTKQATAFATAKAARLEARSAWNAAASAGDKVAEAAAEAAFMAAKDVESAAGQAAAAAVAAASVASQAAQEVSAEVASVAQEAAAAAQEVSAEVAAAVQDATRAAQEATVAALQEIASTPGMDKWGVRRANAAVKAAEAEIAGTSYDYQGAVNKINNDEKAWNAARGN